MTAGNPGVTGGGFRLSPQQRRLWSLARHGAPAHGGALPQASALGGDGALAPDRALASDRTLASNRTMAPDDAVLLAGCAVDVRGALDREALRGALDALVSRHEILRTTFHLPPGMTLPVQVVGEAPRYSWSDDAASDVDLGTFLSRISFDLERGPVLHVHLVCHSDSRHTLVVGLTALCADDAALHLLVSDLASIYADLASVPARTPGAAPDGDEAGTPLQYADVAEWMNGLLEAEENEAERSFWTTRGADVGRGVRLPFERDVPAAAGFGRGTFTLALTADRVTRLRDLAASCGVTVPALLLSCWQVLLAKLSGHADVAVAVAGDGRNYEGLDRVLGPFVRFLPVSARVDGRAPLAALAHQVKHALDEAEAKQEYFDAGTDADDEPGFVFQYLERSGAPHTAGPVTFAVTETHVDDDRFGLRLSCTAAGRDLTVTLSHDTARYATGSVAVIADQLLTLLDRASASAAIRDLDLLSDDERRRLLIDFNRTATGSARAGAPGDTERQPARTDLETLGAGARQRRGVLAGAGDAAPPPDARCFHHWFEAQVERTPEAVAVVAGAAHVSYRALNARANALAHRLRRLGVGPEATAGVYLDRSIELIVGLLGVLKAGAAYVPLDRAWPRVRLAHVVRDAGMAVILTRDGLADELPDDGPPRIAVDDRAAASEATSHPESSEARNPERTAFGGTLAYVIYTSGSTGAPKGVRIEHRALANYLAWALDAYRVAEGHGAPVHASIGFDATITALFLPLIAGRPIHLVAETDEVEGLAATLRAQADFSLVKLTPAHLDVLGELLPPADAAGAARALVIGGEALLDKHLAFWREHAPATRLVNEYGPTETVVGCCVHDATGTTVARGAVPIGFPIANTRLYVVDHAMRPLARGVAGELLIGGAGVARDYLDRPRLTAEKFVPDPFAAEPGRRLYRSGDLVRHLPGRDMDAAVEPGPLEFLGRVDHQVKLRGFRIELGEIEAALSTHPAVREQVVVLHEDARGERRLVAYVEAASEAPRDLSAALRAFLAERLPDAMVPTVFVRVDRFTLTSNGKVDRRALPAPDVRGGDVPYVAPRTETERLLAGLWTRLLGVERAGVDDHFFRLGGHSLSATRLVSGIRDVFEVELPLRAVFDAPALRALAAEVDTLAATNRHVVPPIEPVPRDDPARRRLSFAQQRLWFLDRLEDPSATYNIPGAVRLRGTLDLAAAERAFAHVVMRHEALRTRFVEEDGQPVAIVDDDAVCPVQLVPLEHLPGDARDAEAARMAGVEASTPFDLAHDRLVRVTALRLAADDHVLLVTMHHVVSDGWSMGVLVREFSTLYAAHVTERPVRLPPLAVQYADYACWQRRWLTEDVLGAQLDHWRRRLAGAPPLLELPTDRPRPAALSHRGQSLAFALPDELCERLRALCRETDTTLSMALLAGYTLLLSRYSGQDDVVVGSVTANRGRAEVEPLIGFFVNTLCFRTDLSGAPTVAELLSRVRRTCLDAFANQDAPFELVVEAVGPERHLSHAPIFQAAFQLQNAPAADLEMPGLTLAMMEQDSVVAKFDLLLAMEERDGAIGGVVEFSTDLFDRGTIERLTAHYGALLDAMTADPQRSIEQLDLLSAEERSRLLAASNATAPAEPPGTMHGLFERGAAAAPDRAALVFDDRVLTYGEVERRANRVAHHLATLGVGPEGLVGLCVPRSADAVVALLGVLKAGGAYVPLDPAWPAERLEFMARDSGVAVLVTVERLLRLVPAVTHTVCLDRDADAIARHPTTRPRCGATPENVAYVIYTSGSTGRPKGVQVTHRGVPNLAAAQSAAFGVGPSSRVYQFASPSFDAAVSELVMAFASGATVDLGTSRELLPGPDLAAHFRDAGVTHVTLPPSSLPLLPDPDRLPLQTLVVAGEACPAETLSAWKRGRRVFNAYGPTEFTVCVSEGECPADDVAPPIGTPLPGARTWVVDRRLRLVPDGFPGELLAGGIQLARGYLGRPALTAERFVPDPFANEPGARVYRTGDLVRRARRDDGVLTFLGRVDHQVKLHGYRVEPGEIEDVLRRHPDVGDAAVVPARGDGLLAFVTPRRRVELWPSVAEFYVYDDAVYRSMATHRSRNDKYLAAFRKVLPGKTVVEIGPGPEAVLARLCLDAGAEKVYAIERLEATWRRARDTVRSLGLQDRIALIHGDAMDVNLPEPVDYCVSEIVGAIGGAEGAARIIERAKRFLRDISHVIPERSVTRIAAITLPAELDPSFSDVAAHYVHRIFAEVGRPFDLRLCLKNLPLDCLLSTSEVFEELDFRAAMPADESHEIELTAVRDGRMHGLLAWLTLSTDRDHVVDILAEPESWLPVYFPLFESAVDVARGDRIRATVSRRLSANGLNPDYAIGGRIVRRSGGTVDFAYEAPHVATAHRATPFYRTLFSGDTVPVRPRVSDTALRAWLRASLPDHMVPSRVTFLDALPQTPNGKIDRRALGALDRGARRATFTAPATEAEARLAGIWTDVLGTGRVGRDDDFFALGGHSLVAMRVISAIRDVFGVELPLRRIFETPALRELAAQLAVERGDGPTLPPIVARTTGEPAPLSFAQQRLWFLDRLEDLQGAYHIVAAVRMRGALDVAALERAIADIVRRHEALRTSFVAERGVPVQVIRPHAGVALDVVHLDHLPASEAERETPRLIAETARRPFDLARDSLLRATLVRVDARAHVLVVVMHHIVSDGWSMGVFVRELTTLYEAHATGTPSDLPALPVQYADFATWQRRWLDGTAMDARIEAWRRALDGAPEVLELPTDRPRSAARSYRGGVHTFRLDSDLARRVKALGQRAGTTLFMTLLAGWAALLARASGQDDVVVGSPVAGRDRREIEPLIGFFVNMLPLRTDLRGAPTVAELLERVRHRCLDAFAHADVPFEKLVDVLAPERDLSHSPLFQAAFMWESEPLRTPAMPGLDVSMEPIDTAEAKFDLSLGIAEAPDGSLEGDLEYSADLFDAATIARLAERFRLVLEGMAADPSRAVAAIPLILDDERDRLAEWNATRAVRHAYRRLDEACEARAAAAPDAVAVVDGEASLTLGALNRRANRVAHHLRRLGVGPEVPVGVCVRRSIDMVVGLLGVLKAGGAYVPLDPSYPRERLALMTRQARLGLVLVHAGVEDVLPDDVIVIRLDDDATLAGEPEIDPSWRRHSDLAYVLYTSGSTGVPKGVTGLHSSTLNRIAWMEDAYPFVAAEVAAQKTSLNFVDSVWEIWAPLLHGVPLVVLPEAVLADPGALVAALAGHRVSRLVLVPSLLRVMLDDGDARVPRLSDLRYCVSSGETLPADLARRFRDAMPATVLLNLYGSTEVAGDATFEEVTVADGVTRVPIGRPIANLRAYVVDGRGEPVPPGMRGELRLGGAGLARGYDRMPALTAERFVPDPFGPEPGGRLYRTGDLARHRGDGRIEYLGRADQQVKVRGFRVEPGEIEATLRRHPAIAQALVTARRRATGSDDVSLVAYVVPRDGLALDVADVRDWTRRQLPGYMVPAAFVALPALPLLPNGKVDRKALPAPDPGGADDDATAPRTPAEELLADIWAGVLGVRRVGIHGSFFDLGGHSLLATRVVARVREVFGVEIPVRALFESPTVAGLAERVGLARGSAPERPAIQRLPRHAERTAFPLSAAQERVWFLERFEGGTSAFHMPVAWKLTGAFDTAAFEAALDTVVRRHESLRTLYPDPGPDGVPVQVVLAEPPRVLTVIDLRGDAAERREAEARRHVDAAVLTPFDLASAPPLRVMVVELDDRTRYVVLNLHHVAGDGWSMSLLVRELAAYYTALVRGERLVPAPLPFQYADVAAWQRARLAEDELAPQLAYWTRQLGGDPEVLDFPTDHPRPPILTFRGDRCSATLAAPLTSAIDALGRANGASLFMTLLAAFELLLARHTGQTDILVGTPIAGRHHAGLESQVGMFLNNLVLRTDLSGDPSFVELLARVRETCLAAYDHQDVPLEKLLEALSPQRDLGRNSLYQVSFNMLNMPPLEARLPGVAVETLATPEIGAKYDFTLYVERDGGGLRLDLSYNAVLFERDRMTLLLSQYRNLVSQIAGTPDARISRYDLVDPVSAARLPDPTLPLDDAWHGAVHELFHRRAATTPERPAVVTSRQVWTYAELAERVDRLAGTLIANGVRQGDVVAILGARAAPMVQAVLGILRAGAAFLILDPAYPDDRLIRYLELASPRGWIELERADDVSPALRGFVDALPFRAKIRLSDDGEIAPASTDGLAAWHSASTTERAAGVARETFAWPEVGPDDAAVVAFTSGSTGLPKGIVGRHGPLTHFVPWMAERFGLDDRDRYSMLSGLAHDPLQRDIFTPLCLGATVCSPDAAEIDPNRLARWMRRDAVTVTLVTPAMADVLTQTTEAITLDALRTIFLVGDRLTTRIVGDLRRLAPRATVVNLYGATESQRAVSYHVVPADRTVDPGGASEVLPLGRGMRDVQLLVLTKDMRLAGIGELGDIYIRSPHLARGYLHDDEQTRHAFLTNPFTGVPGDRIYRTGDTGRCRPDGDVAFVERADFQVKVRGYRVELPEIEAALARHPLVRQAVVLVREDRARGDRQLVAYVRTRRPAETSRGFAGSQPDDVAAGGPVDTTLRDDLRRHLARALPAFMIPAAIVFVDAIPLTPNNKIDRRALAEMPVSLPVQGDADAGPRAPATATESTLAGIWREVLARPVIGADENFFDLGGHSLLAVRVVTRVRDTLGVELPLHALFEAPTIRSLAARIAAAAAERGVSAPLAAVPRDRPLPLSFSQQRLWFLDRLEGTGAAYNIPTAVWMTGELDVPAVARALDEIVARHEILRTSFIASDDGQPVQVIRETGGCPLATLSLASGPAVDEEAEINRRAVEEAERPFDLERDRLVRATLLRLHETSHVLLVTMHHIVSDGWSIGILVRELIALYEAFVAGRPSPLPDLPIQYADYAVHQRTQLDGAALRDGLDYWTAQCAGAPARLDLPTDRPRPPVQSYRGGAVDFALDADFAAHVLALARSAGVTVFMTLFAAFTTTLARTSGQDDFLCGVPVANRGAREVEPLIGFFVNTLALRADVTGDPTVRELLARVRRTALDGFAHGDVPFERLVEALRPERSLSHAPLFQVMFVLHNTPGFDVTLPGLAFSAVERETTTTKFDLTLSMTETADGFDARLEFNADVFDAATIERYAAHFARVLAGMVEHPDRRVSELPLLDDAESRLLLDTRHRPAPATFTATRVTALIGQWAAAMPDRVAVAYEDELLTYGALDARANRFAHLLRKAGVGRDVRVGLCTDRSAALVVGLLAILKSGGAYVPLDPSYPADRLAFVRADAGLSLVLAQQRFEPDLAAAGLRVLCLDGATPDAPPTAPVVPGSPDDAAYVIYTSGSTGQPKGVAISHRTLMTSNQARVARYGEVPDAFLLLSSVAFDSSVVGIFWTLCGGGTLCIPSSEAIGSVRALTTLIERRRVSHTLCLPSLHAAILEDAETHELASLRSVIVAGEPCSEELIDAHGTRLPGTALFNEYGPTEATVWSSVYDCRAHRGGARVSIGAPIDGSRSYVLDRRRRLVPLGAAGELVIGGDTLARGYVNRPSATAERFVPDPYATTPGARMYRTGDLVRQRLEDGVPTLEFLGRADDQVKIRGFRVEPGEIEARLARHAGVREAVVVARDDARGHVRLVGYVRATGDAAVPSAAELRAFLGETLPDYMIPGAFVMLQRFPLTPNGKVDRRALPAPDDAAAGGRHESPATPTEERLAALWAELLGLARVSALSHFFEAGGHSLLATRLVSRIRKTFGVELTLVELFRAPVLRAMAEHLDNRRWALSGDTPPAGADGDQEEIVL